MVFFDPGHVPEQLADDSIVPPGHLEFDNRVTIPRVNGQDVNEPPAGRKLDSPDSFLLIKLETSFEKCEVFCEVVAEIGLVCKLPGRFGILRIPRRRLARGWGLFIERPGILLRMVEPKPAAIDLIEEIVVFGLRAVMVSTSGVGRKPDEVGTDRAFLYLGVMLREPLENLVASDDVAPSQLDISDHVPHERSNWLIVQGHLATLGVKASNSRDERRRSGWRCAVRCIPLASLSGHPQELVTEA